VINDGHNQYLKGVQANYIPSFYAHHIKSRDTGRKNIVEEFLGVCSLILRKNIMGRILKSQASEPGWLWGLFPSY
jgi:hypothetical protein